MVYPVLFNFFWDPILNREFTTLKGYSNRFTLPTSPVKVCSFLFHIKPFEMGNSVRHFVPVQTRTIQSKSISIANAFLMLLTFLLFSFGCTKDETVRPTTQSDELNIESRAGVRIISRYEQENLVSNVAGYDAEILDPNLVNAWGIALSPTDVFWISATGTDLSVIYNADGVTLRPPVTMDGSPTGQVFNSSTEFMIPDVGLARFIFATHDGTITAWRTGNV